MRALKKKINGFVRYLSAWGPPVLWAGVIFWLSSQQFDQKLMKRIVMPDKFWHTLFFAVLAFFLARALRDTGGASHRKYFRWAAFVFAVAYGLSDEIHQAFVPCRSASLWDLCFDALGGFIGPLFVRSSTAEGESGRTIVLTENGGSLYNKIPASTASKLRQRE